MHRRSVEEQQMKQSARTARWTLGATLVGLAAAACNPSPHIDPSATTGGGGTTATGGAGGTSTTDGGGGGTTTTMSSSGGGGSTGCTSNAGCSYPKNLCDTASGECVECLVSADCSAKDGTVCSKAECLCPVTGQDFCAKDGYGLARCVDQATSSKDCGECGHECFGDCKTGKCVGAWEPTATFGAPSGRSSHVAVWADNQMIVWGGRDNSGAALGDGGIYDPATRGWKPVSPANAPTARYKATAVWTGTEMIVWGGIGPNGTPLDDGKKFNPATGIWINLSSGAPPGRYDHSAIWTNLPEFGMIVWGGFDGTNYLDSGGYYNAAEVWNFTSSTSPPTPRRLHTAVWDDVKSRMLVYGGYGFDIGSMTNTTLGTVTALGPLLTTTEWFDLPSSGPAPAPRQEHTAVWAGNEMIVWGGTSEQQPGLLGDGARFDAAGNNEWSTIDGTAPSARRQHTAVYFKTLKKMVVWGGLGAGNAPLKDGGVFDVALNTWDAKGLPTLPSPSVDHTAVVAGDRMIVWGGSYTNKGAILDMTKL
jgi:N-acetylneuraminic acid mutarotase